MIFKSTQMCLHAAAELSVLSVLKVLKVRVRAAPASPEFCNIVFAQ